jgi:hypothetical protein
MVEILLRISIPPRKIISTKVAVICIKIFFLSGNKTAKEEKSKTGTPIKEGI